MKPSLPITLAAIASGIFVMVLLFTPLTDWGGASAETEIHSQNDSNPIEAPAPQQKLVTTTRPHNDTPLSFNEHIQPILSAACFHCHGPDSHSRLPKKKPLRLDLEKGAFANRENGKPVIVKGDPDNSYLMELMESTDKDKVMPPHPSKHVHGKILPKDDIALVRRWIKEGAVYEDHWAYIPPTRSPLPSIKNTEWPRNPMDYFVANTMEKKNLAPSKNQEKPRLLRRLSFDLTGLPPRPEEVIKFVNDPREFDIVYLEKVNQLLKSDTYAEHFTRHWLDAARYGDTHAIQLDNHRAIWPYRDWVINAFRKNMRFDQFTREQIAGDMMPNPSTDQLVATGFNRCMPTTGEGAVSVEEWAAINAQEQVNTTSAVWLGLTMNCASCHDHKFDRISTKENYQFTAFFRNTTMHPTDNNVAAHAPILHVPADQDRARHKVIDQEITSLEKRAQALKTSAKDDPNTQKIIQQLALLKQEKAAILKRSDITLIMEEKKTTKPTAHVLIRGAFDNKGDEVLNAGVPSMLPSITKDMPRNRLGLAMWLTSPANPLPARVTVNRFWSYFFGQGLVKTSGDFGVMGARPSHPKLLDWLATDFIENGWDFHHLIRTIVTSSTYRQSPVVDAGKRELDPSNKWLARGPRYRLDAEQIRDLALSSSGLLHEQLGGPSVKPYQPANVWESVAPAHPTANTRFYKQDTGNKLYRRSLYTYLKRSAPHPTMQLFDSPDRVTPCLQRELTNTPLQSLVLMNDPQFAECSRQLATHAIKSSPSVEKRINYISMRLLSRKMSPQAIAIITRSLQNAYYDYQKKPGEAQLLINIGESKPTADIDPLELASWTLAASHILNMDECITK